MIISHLQLIRDLCMLSKSKFILFTALISVSVASFYFVNSYAVISIKDPNLNTEIVAQGLNYPTAMAFLNTNEILVSQKDEGNVVRIVNGNISNHTVLSLTVNHVQERGLLGIAIENDKESDEIGGEQVPKYVFLFYTEPRYNGSKDIFYNSNVSSECREQKCLENQFNNRLYRYEYKDNKLVNPKILIDIPIEWNNHIYPKAYSAIMNGETNWLRYPLREGTHQGGKIVLDHDNNVFLVTGDGGGCFTHDGCYRSIKNGFLSVQTANKIGGAKPTGLGGILYVTRDGDPALKNGTIGDENLIKYYYAYGIRNSFGLDIDPLTGKLWDTENGPHYGDEINLVESGFNSGWAKIQGPWPVINYTYLYLNSINKGYHYSDEINQHIELEDFNGRGHYSDPEFTWNASIGVTAIKFLDTERYGKKYQNDIIVGDAYGRLYHFDLNENRTGLNLTGLLSDKVANSASELSNLIFGEGFDTITDMQIGPDGYLYVLSYTGKIVKVVPKVTIN